MKERKFSIFLKNFIDERKLSVASLAAQMKISNKTVITRILNDKATSSNISAFAQKLISSFQLTDDEINTINNAISYEQLPDSVVTSRRVLSFLYTRNPKEVPNKLLCTLKNAEKCEEKKYLYDDIHNILNSDPEDEYEIFIESVNTLAFTKALYNILHDGKKRNISIHQYFCETDDVTENIHHLYSLLRLTHYASYFAYVISPKIINSSRLNIINRTKNRAHLINIYNTSSYTSLDMNIGGTDFFAHLMQEFEILKEHSTPLRNGFESPFEALPEYIDLMAKLDACVTYEMKSTPCFGMIPFEIQHKLYADSNFLGLGFDNPVVQKLYTTMEKREKALYKENGVKKNIVLYKNGVEKFLESGLCSDHVPVLRALSKDEAVFTLKKLLNNTNANIYLLKDDFCITNAECVLFESNSLVVFDPSLGYWDNFSEIQIKNKKMLRIMRDFISEEIIKHCCYSLEESKQMLLSMC